MRPEFRSTRSARAVPTYLSASMGVKEKKNCNRRTSLPPDVSSATREQSMVAESSWKKQVRHRMTDEQFVRLSALYDRNTHPSTAEKQCLGREIGL